MESMIAAVESKASLAKSNVRALHQIYMEATNAGLADEEFRLVTDPIISKTEDIIITATHVEESVRALKVTDPNFLRRIMTLVPFADEDFVNSKVELDKITKAFADAKERKKAKEEEESRNEAGGSNA